MTGAINILPELNEVFKDVFMRDDLVISPDTTAEDVKGWDSFKQIEIVMMVEARYGIKLHTGDLDKLTSVGDLVEVIRGKIR